MKPTEIDFDGLIEGFESLKFTIKDQQVILRILEVCREHNIFEKQDVLKFAEHVLPPGSDIDNNFADAFEDCVIETEEEIKNNPKNVAEAGEKDKAKNNDGKRQG